jgi:hypothetical protein
MISILVGLPLGIHAYNGWNLGQTSQLILYMSARDLEAPEDGFPGLFNHTEKPWGGLPCVLAPFIVDTHSQVWYLREGYIAAWAWALPHILDVCD